MAGYIGSKASVVSSGAERKKVFDITTSTTALTGLSYTANQVHVFHNGVRLISGTDYTETNDTTITLTNAAENGDQVVVVSYASFQTSDTVSASAGGTFSNAVTIDGNLTVDTDTLFVDTTNDRVGIGTSSPEGQLHIYSSSVGTPSTDADDFVIEKTGDTGLSILSTTTGRIYFGDAASNDQGSIRYIHSDNSMRFETDSSERLRIDGSGVIRLGNLNEQLGGGTNYLSCSGNGYSALRVRRGADAGSGVAFYGPNSSVSAVGSIDIGTSSVSYVTSSDYRLKENVAPLADAADRLAQIPVHRFNFIADPDTTVDGFLAHEVQAFVPEAVTGEKDAVDADGNPVHQGIDQSKLVPLLTAALQEALTEITDLKARVEALEAV